MSMLLTYPSAANQNRTPPSEVTRMEKRIDKQGRRQYTNKGTEIYYESTNPDDGRHFTEGWLTYENVECSLEQKIPTKELIRKIRFMTFYDSDDLLTDELTMFEWLDYCASCFPVKYGK